MRIRDSIFRILSLFVTSKEFWGVLVLNLFATIFLSPYLFFAVFITSSLTFLIHYNTQWSMKNSLLHLMKNIPFVINMVFVTIFTYFSFAENLFSSIGELNILLSFLIISPLLVWVLSIYSVIIHYGDSDMKAIFYGLTKDKIKSLKLCLIMPLIMMFITPFIGIVFALYIVYFSLFYKQVDKDILFSNVTSKEG